MEGVFPTRAELRGLFGDDQRRMGYDNVPTAVFTHPNVATCGLTEAAARHITRYLSRRGKGVGVRLGVKTTGCSGLAYKLEYADEMTLAKSISNRIPVENFIHSGN